MRPSTARAALAGETVAICAEPARMVATARRERLRRRSTERRSAEARSLLDAASFAPCADLPLATIEHAILTAWLAHAEGRAAESRRRLTEALELAAEHGIVSAFVWAGPEVIKLVEAIALRSDAVPRRGARVRT